MAVRLFVIAVLPLCCSSVILVMDIFSYGYGKYFKVLLQL